MILVSHALDDLTLARWREWQAGCNATHDTFLALTTCARAAATALGLTDVLFVEAEETYLPDYLPKGTSRKVVPGNFDLVMLALRRRLPGYRYYLFSEYDVFLPGGHAAVLAAAAASSADLIGSIIRPPEAEPDWSHWRSLRPGPKDAAAAVRRAALLCFARYSGRLLDALDAAYRSGWNGHFEATVPTLAATRGLAVETWNDAAARVGLAPLTDDASFHWRRMRPVAPHLAHHPVKTLREARDVAAALGMPAPLEVPPW